MGCEIVNWIHLTQVRVQWWALVNMVMNLWFPYEIYWIMGKWIL